MMAGIRQVISTLTNDGQEIMGPEVLLWHYPNNDIINGSLLTVESNHFCVLKSRGAILAVYETGQYPVQTPQKILFGSIQQAFYGGQSPWQYEAIYINRAKLVIKTSGLALSREMAEMAYDVDYYVHVATPDNAVALVQHMPYRGHMINTMEVNAYAGPVVEQAINQLIQVTPLERVNEKIHDLTQLVYSHLQQFLATYGISLDTVKVLVRPSDVRMKALISLKAFGLSELDAVRYYTAMIMAERGTVSAPNMAIGQPFNIGSVTPVMNTERFIAPPQGGMPPMPPQAPRPPAANQPWPPNPELPR
ncbi:SPFH domain-containing protein [Candidatus Chlorohelix allophototropha]|uniref:SPFH domain-containing protein n=2 Tax=Candidatus Chlorohelix allophototropha TaxID=3003348 RepID=A0ABY9B498_9CHLR|nr:SPFH domain-containing protein [Chloroflexota bacterium L227-S17]